MYWVSIALLITTAISAFLDKKIITHFPKKSEKKERKEFYLSWAKLAVIISITVFSFFNDAHQKTEKETDKNAEQKRDSTNAAKYADSLKSFSSNIVNLLGKYNLKYDSATNKIKQAIDTTKVRQEPYISFINEDLFDNQVLKHKQSNDTLFFSIALENRGNLPAYNLTYSTYFITYDESEDLFREYPTYSNYRKLNINLAVNEYLININNAYITGYKIDSACKRHQIFYLKGRYFVDDKNGIEKKFKLGYEWNCHIMKWVYFNDINKLNSLDYVHSKMIKYK